MAARPTSIISLALLLIALSPQGVIADPGRSLLSPVLSLSGRLGDPEHMVNPLEVPPSGNGSVSDADEFASGEPATPYNGDASLVEGASGSGRSAVSLGSGGMRTLNFDYPVDSTEAPLREYRDTLISSDRSSLVDTLAGEGSERLPDSWAVPPGSSVPGGHPGYRREVASLDYSGSPGVAYFPPPVYDGASSGPAYSYPGSGPYPGGPFGYDFAGVDPSGPAWVQGEVRSDYGLGLSFLGDFDTESAHLKAGPFYFRAVAVEAGLLYSDYNGPQSFAPGEEDGWLSFAGFDFQLGARLAPSLYLTAGGRLIYLFGENELGIRSGLGTGGPFARLVNEGVYGSWEVTLFAEAGTGSFYNTGFGADAYDRAGRYTFGFLGYENRERFVYDPFLYTRVGAEATTPTSEDWRLTLSADHSDFWYLGDDRDDRHGSRDHLGVLYGAEPGRVPFTPWFSYDLFANDGFETVYNTIYAGGSGRLSQNVILDGRVGYLWTPNDSSDNEHWLWQIGLRHRINERTTHGVRVGQDYFMSEFSTDSSVSNFVHYYLDHKISDRMSFSGYAQFSSDEYLSGNLSGDTYDREMYGVRLSVVFTDRVTGNVGYRVEHSRDEQVNRDYDRSIFDANLNVELGARTSAYFRYQHENTNLFYEDLYMSGIRRRF